LRLWFCSSNKPYSKTNPTFHLGIFRVIGHFAKRLTLYPKFYIVS
jgi:hypothetical protein